MRSNRTPASVIAFGGVLAALAVVIMSMGTLIPVATYVCPMLCCLLLSMVNRTCGKRLGWAWYGAVTLLSLLMTRLAFLLAGGLSELLGCESEGRLLGELGTVYGFMIAVVSMSSVMFILALSIFVKTTVAAA